MSMRCLRWPVAIVLLAVMGVGLSRATAADAPQKETPAERDARMQWWREARFGLFIHWGLYAVPAGEWQGKPVGGIGEWIMDRANIPVEEYEKLAKQFNPTKFDAAAWAKAAKQAGIKYVVITSKHHDGFCLFDTKTTDYDVVDATPYKKDLLKPLAEACRKEGIKFCTYYSIMDWHHPAQYRGSEKNYNPTKVYADKKSEYIAYMNRHLKELIESTDTEVMWFDGEWPNWWTEEDGQALYAYLRKLKPSLIINNRVGKGRKGMEGLSKGDREYSGDFGTPEQQIPATGLPGVDWESCMTMNDTWGFKKDDHNWKSAEKLIRNLIDIASKGGNYLLNVGPTAEGEIPAASLERLKAMGDWMAVNGESIYGTQASPLKSTPWGRCTKKSLAGGKTRLYLHVFDRPQDGKLVLPMSNKVVAVKLLAGGQVEATSAEGKITVTLPAQLPDKIATVVTLDIEGEPQVAVIDPYANETAAQRDARMKWWREARFGMFIHWGVYSVPGGTYHDKRIGGIGEWIMHNAKIPSAEYKQYAKQFNPVKYDADAWVRLAKEAGMNYIVITSKHHDGFALFDSKVTDWDIVDATPYKKDLLKPLAEACRKHGVKLGFYYSQAQDWNHPGGAAAGGHWDKAAQDGSMDEYVRKIAVPQVREILTNYGDIAVLWWDTPMDMNKQRAEMLLPLLSLQPGIIHNNRLGGGYHGDTETPEQFIPPTGYPGRDWETCMTMNDTWGFKSYDQNWKPTEKLIANLIDIASKGGNYLLNVGPTPEGEIPAPSVERLKEVGKWMKVNGAAIYGTSASPFKRLPWGRCTKKIEGDATTLYLHVFDWPSDGKLVVPGLKNEPTAAHLLVEPGKALKVTREAANVTIALPSEAPDKIASVVVLKVKGEPVVEEALLAQRPDGVLELMADEAKLHGGTIKTEALGKATNVGYWTDSSDWIDWRFEITKPGKFDVVAEMASQGSGSFVVAVPGDKFTAKAPKTGDYKKYEVVTLGTLSIPAASKSTLSIKAVHQGWSPINVRKVTLKPVK